MIRIFSISLFISFLLCVSQRAYSQDVMYSQAYAAPMLISPSFAGLTYGSRVSMNYRNQWPGASGAYVNYALSWDGFFEKYNSGVGIMFNRNDQGEGMYIYQNLSLLYSYDLEIIRGFYIRPGIQFQLIDRSLNYDKLYFGDQINPDNGAVVIGANDVTGTLHNYKFDAATSVMGYNKFAWLGFSADHLVKSEIGYTDLGNYNNMKLTAFGGTKFDLRKVLSGQTQQTLSFAFNYRSQGGFNQLEFGTYWFLNPLELGLWYRAFSQDAVIFIAGVSLGSLKMAYSYDMTLSDLAGYSGGSHEISLIIQLNDRFTSKSRYGAIPCPGVNHSFSGANKYTNTRRKSGVF